MRMLATDIDTDILTKAARGEFAVRRGRGCAATNTTSSSRAAAGQQTVVVPEKLRAMIAFRQLNLLGPWPFKGLFDAIFCRNVMIYFDAQTKSTLVDRFTKQLRPGGWLYIGHSESLYRLASRPAS